MDDDADPPSAKRRRTSSSEGPAKRVQHETTRATGLSNGPNYNTQGPNPNSNHGIPTAGPTPLSERTGQNFPSAQASGNARQHVGNNYNYNYTLITAPENIVAPDAAFDSRDEARRAKCLEGTRASLLQQIYEWADDAKGKAIFWLNGMAGTGKSTISRTVAQRLKKKNQLGASFFFKRGHGDRKDARKFFPTIGQQLSEGLDADVAIPSNILEKDLTYQFETLIFEPMASCLDNNPMLPCRFIVLDALDECGGEDDYDIKTLLTLISQAKVADDTTLRWFITSRPELPVRKKFAEMARAIHRDSVLHEITRESTYGDIRLYLENEFSKIREYYSLQWSGDEFEPDWPEERTLEILVHRSSPLFIYAATIVRFLGEEGADPVERLGEFLQPREAFQSTTLNDTYLTILNRYLLVYKKEHKHDDRAQKFRNLVGPIILLAEPLSSIALSNLLGRTLQNVRSILDPLHSVIEVPKEESAPVQPLHASFPEFLLDREESKSHFWIDKVEAHRLIFRSSLALLDEVIEKLIRDLANEEDTMEERTSWPWGYHMDPAATYALRYWVYHLKHLTLLNQDEDVVFAFLRKHFLDWIVVLAMNGKFNHAVEQVQILETLFSNNYGSLAEFVHDARVFTLTTQTAFESSPLQIYSSVLALSPESSWIRKTFKGDVPRWLSDLPVQSQTTTPEEPPTADVIPDKIVIFTGQNYRIESMMLSPNGRWLAIADSDGPVQVWDTSTGYLSFQVKHKALVKMVRMSSDSRIAVSASVDGALWVWNLDTGRTRLDLTHQVRSVRCMAVSPDGRWLAIVSARDELMLWDIRSDNQGPVLDQGSFRLLTFSRNSESVALVSDAQLHVWDIATVTKTLSLPHRNEYIVAVDFSPDGNYVVTATHDWTLRLWNFEAGELYKLRLKENMDPSTISFADDGLNLRTDRDVFSIQHCLHFSHAEGGDVVPLYIEEDCVFWKGRKNLWLSPWDYDGPHTIQENKLAIARNHKEVHVFTFE